MNGLFVRTRGSTSPTQVRPFGNQSTAFQWRFSKVYVLIISYISFCQEFLHQNPVCNFPFSNLNSIYSPHNLRRRCNGKFWVYFVSIRNYHTAEYAAFTALNKFHIRISGRKGKIPFQHFVIAQIAV